jgi:hypothetical protein
MIREALWRIVAFIVTRPAITAWLICRAQRTPYRHIHGPDGSLYMGRWWLFNPYPIEGQPDMRAKWLQRLPSARIHHIVRPDSDRHLHDHPWNARTIVLRNWYKERRICSYVEGGRLVMESDGKVRHEFTRERGYTGQLLFGEYHRISEVAPGGVFTLFITWEKLGTWGFLVDGNKVPWREYLGIAEKA